MFDESFWVAVAFVLFCALFGRRLWTFATGRLDRRGEAVRAELEQAVQLREEAQNLLAAHRRRERETAREAGEIVSRARDEAKRIVSAAQVRAAQEVVRRTRAADVRIARMQTRAAADARAAAAELVGRRRRARHRRGYGRSRRHGPCRRRHRRDRNPPFRVRPRP